MEPVSLIPISNVSPSAVVFFLQTAPASFRPIQVPPHTRREEVSVSRETGKIISMQSTRPENRLLCF